MDKHQTAADIIKHVLPLVPFEGWNQATLQKAAHAAGYKKTDAIRVFPGGALDAIDFFMRMADEKMLLDAEHYTLDTMKIRQRIALLVRLWIEGIAPHREALRQAVALQSLPFNAHHGLKNLYRTVDAMWHAAGDTSTDFNFYTKRLLLAGVYTSTLQVWLNDKSPGFEYSWGFLDRRIEDVMRIEKTKHMIKNWMSKR